MCPELRCTYCSHRTQRAASWFVAHSETSFCSTVGVLNSVEARFGTRLRSFVPHVEELFIARGGNGLAPLVGGAIQRRPYVLLAFDQFRQRHLQRDPRLELIKVGEDLRHNFLVLAVAALRNVGLGHRFEVHRHLLAQSSHRNAPPRSLTKLT